MADTAIEWTNVVWNPTTGCDTVSPGCDNCYARPMAKRLKAMGSAKYQTDGDSRTSGPGFGIAMHEDALTLPLTWRKPRKVFVNSMSDLFHKGVSDEFIAKVWAVMAATPQHTYQVLTKRHGRMRSFLRDECRCGSGHPPGTHLLSAMSWAATPHNPGYVPGLTTDAVRRGYEGITFGRPLKNVWAGVSVEDQQRADLRIPALLETPAAVRFLSCEPLLGPVDLFGPVVGGHRPRLHYWLAGRPIWGPEEIQPSGLAMQPLEVGPSIDWVIAGGESGHGARPVEADWIRTLRDQCVSSGVAFLFKQWGGRTPKANGHELDGRTWDEYPVVTA